MEGFQQATFHTFWQGCVLGEAETVAGTPYTYTVTTATNCRLLYIHRFIFLSNIPTELVDRLRVLTPLLTSAKASELRDGYLKLQSAGHFFGKDPGMGQFREAMLQRKVEIASYEVCSPRRFTVCFQIIGNLETMHD